MADGWRPATTATADAVWRYAREGEGATGYMQGGLHTTNNKVHFSQLPNTGWATGCSKFKCDFPRIPSSGGRGQAVSSFLGNLVAMDRFSRPRRAFA